MTTKEQEREALNKIRKILGTLDADGWVCTAFKGVCEIAERNIEDDFASSPVERVDELEEEIVNYEETLEEVRKELVKMKVEIRNRESEIRNREADITHLSAKIERYKKDISDAFEQSKKQKNALEMIIQKLEKGLEELNATILKHCEHPESPEFTNAVASRRETREMLDTLVDVY